MNWDDDSSELSFSGVREQLDSLGDEPANEQAERFWTSSLQTGFNFEEDGPRMIAPQVSTTAVRPSNLPIVPKIDLKSPKEISFTPTAQKSTPRECVENIFLGKSFNLEQFRTRETKSQLLDCAIIVGDTSTLQVVILFLRGSLKSSLFQQELMARPVALRAYLNYLRENGEAGQFSEQLTLSGSANEVHFHKYRQTNRLSDVKALQNSLEASLNSVFVGSADFDLMKDQVSLLQLQTKINDIDRVTIVDCENIVGASLTETVKYCAKYHARDPEAHFSAPAFLRRVYRLSSEQYSYACITGFAESQNYAAIDSFLEGKSWLGKKKISSAIGFDKVVLILFRNKAPNDVIEKYIAYVDDVEERIELAEKVGALCSLVNCYVQLKDRTGLEKVLGRLPRDSPATQLAHSSLRNPAVKWKN